MTALALCFDKKNASAMRHISYLDFYKILVDSTLARYVHSYYGMVIGNHMYCIES